MGISKRLRKFAWQGRIRTNYFVYRCRESLKIGLN